MQLQQRIDLMVRLGEYMQNESAELTAIKEKAFVENGWFTNEFVTLAINNIANQFLQKALIEKWVALYNVPAENVQPKNVGIVMAGNIPLVGFHDLLCVFISGNKATVKASSKDQVLIKHIADKLFEWEPETKDLIVFAETLKNCDAYIATGSNNSGRYFEYYFGKYPSIIRKNKTSIAIIDGSESPEQLEKLVDDMQLFFGLGCRNVTKLLVPENYDFIPLLQAAKRYEHLLDFHKYKHNYDYQLALLIMNNKFYMSGGALIFTENESIFAPVSIVNYAYYQHRDEIIDQLIANPDIQCIVGRDFTSFGYAQSPSLRDYADGIDTMQFLTGL